MASTEGARAPLAASDEVAELDEEVVPECTACGACCFSELHTYVAVSGSDYARIGDGVDEWVDFDGHKAHLKMVAGHCAALRVEQTAAIPEGQPSATVAGGTRGHFTCDIYARRPETCRTLERGSPMCRAERAHKRSRTLVAAASLIRER
jgi:Fe-S-cluster containining protein